MKVIFNKIIKNDTLALAIKVLLYVVVIGVFVYALSFSTGLAIFDNIKPNPLTGKVEYTLPIQVLNQAINFKLYGFSLTAVICLLILAILKIFKLKTYNIVHFSLYLVIIICLCCVIKYLFVDVQELKALYISEYSGYEQFDPNIDVDSLTIEELITWYNLQVKYSGFSNTGVSYDYSFYTISLYIGIALLVLTILFTTYLVFYFLYIKTPAHTKEYLEHLSKSKSEAKLLLDRQKRKHYKTYLVKDSEFYSQLNRLQTQYHESITSAQANAQEQWDSEQKRLIYIKSQVKTSNNKRELEESKLKLRQYYLDVYHFLAFWV
ncbi:MAG: hypothetical protein LBV55_02905 [Acholeplasmatales bacterium]|nr:hypothetical protein [Acholeplasmatales bacterium]